MSAGDTKTDLLLRAIGAVRDVKTLDEALLELVRTLKEPLGLWYASVSLVSPDGTTLRLLATWSVAESVFVAGTEVSTAITPTIKQVIEVLGAGEPKLVDFREETASLVNHLMREQGAVAAVAVPLQSPDKLLMLVLCSATDGALQGAGLGFFRSLGGGICEKLLSLPVPDADALTGQV